MRSRSCVSARTAVSEHAGVHTHARTTGAKPLPLLASSKRRALASKLVSGGSCTWLEAACARKRQKSQHPTQSRRAGVGAKPKEEVISNGTRIKHSRQSGGCAAQRRTGMLTGAALVAIVVDSQIARWSHTPRTGVSAAVCARNGVWRTNWRARAARCGGASDFGRRFFFSDPGR
jgi:hypothetical protein